MKKVYLMLFLAMVWQISAADIPMVITHQGYITDKEGNGITGLLNFSIGIYKSIDGGGEDLLWEEDLGSVNVKEGFYFVRVGDKGGLKEIFSGYSVLFLEVRVDGKALSPRQSIGSVPYAFVSEDAVGDIHPRSISVGGKVVIDENGKWVGSIPMSKADSKTDGYLSKDDYSRFENKQERISGSCRAGMCMVSVNSDGSVNCEVCGGGGGGSYTAGAGLVLNNSEFSLDPVYLSGSVYDSRFVNEDQANSITSKMIKSGAIEAYHLSSEICGGVGDSVLYFDGTDWRCRAYASGTGTVTVVNTGAGLTGGPITNSGTISLRPEYQSGSAYDDRFVNVDEANSISTSMIKDRAITFNKIGNNGCSTNQYIKWDGTNWSCGTIGGGGTVTQINTALPLQGGPITSSGTISIQQATATTSGYLSSADYQRFEAKQDALGYTPVNRAGDTMSGALNLPSNGLTVGGNQLVVSNTSVGIGTNSPATKLDVIGTGAFTSNITIRGDASEGGQLILNDTNTTSVGESTNSWNIDVVGTKGAGQLRFHRSTSGTKMVINADGKVGIGTSNPDQTLTVAGRIKATQGILVYECPNYQNSCSRPSGCLGQLSVAAQCTYYDCDYECYCSTRTASCTAKGFLVDR